MEKYTNEELLEVLPAHIRELKSTILSPKQKAVLGQLIILDGLDKKNSEGYIFRSNKDLCTDCDIKEEKTVIIAVRKLVWMGFIETIRGSRKEASLYRINKKAIEDYGKTKVDDYCKTPIEDYSNNYSNKIVEMADRIKELENTVKILVERITVIEGKNYSTDKDIDKELDIDKNINNNILNNNIYNINNNILEETVNNKELETEGSEENLTPSQLELDESQASPTEVSTITEPLGEDSHIPTEDEQYQQWLQVLTPCLNELEDARTLEQFRNIKERLSQIGSEYLDRHEYTSPTVIVRMNKTVGSALKTKKEELTPSVMELADYLSRQHNYASL